MGPWGYPVPAGIDETATGTDYFESFTEIRRQAVVSGRRAGSKRRCGP